MSIHSSFMQSRRNRGGGGGGGGEGEGDRQGPVPEGTPLCIAHGGMVPRKMEFVLSLKCSKNSNSEIASPFFPGAEVLGDKVDGLTSEGPRKRKNIETLPPTIRWILTKIPLTSDEAGPSLRWAFEQVGMGGYLVNWN